MEEERIKNNIREWYRKKNIYLDFISDRSQSGNYWVSDYRTKRLVHYEDGKITEILKQDR